MFWAFYTNDFWRELRHHISPSKKYFKFKYERSTPKNISNLNTKSAPKNISNLNTKPPKNIFINPHKAPQFSLNLAKHLSYELFFYKFSNHLPF